VTITASSLSFCYLTKSSDRRRRSGPGPMAGPLLYLSPCPNLSSPYKLPTPVSVMVALDDYRRGDAVPPLTMWQIIQIAPFILFLREYPSRLHSLCPDMGNLTLLLQLLPSYLAYSAKIKVARGAAPRALLQRDTSSACACGRPGSSSPWSASRRLRRMRRGRARTARRSKRTSFPRAQSCTGSGHEEWTW
jgi:hypothetical protein